MHDDVCAVVERVLHVRAHEGVVHDDHDAVLVGNCRDFADVDKGQRGVRGRLNPDELGVWADEFGNVDFDTRAEGHLDVVCEGHFGEVAVRSAVDIRDGHDVRACCERLQNVGCGGGARGVGERIAGVLERCNGLFKVVSAKMPVSRDSWSLHVSKDKEEKTYRLGFEEREYSYSPMGWPTLVCANVVESEI